MALITLNWDLPPKEKTEAYRTMVFFTDEKSTAWIPRMLKQPGVKELRAYRNPFSTTPQVLVLYELDNMTSCLKFIESGDYATFMSELREVGCTNISVQIWRTSPMVPEPLKPQSD